MSRNKSHITKREAIFTDIDRYASSGIGFDLLADMAGYSGPNGIRNIVRQSHHGLSAERWSMLLTELSNREVLHLHRHVLNTTYWQIIPKYTRQDAKGTLGDMQRELSVRTYEAEDAIGMGNIDRVCEYKRFLQRLIARVDAEIQLMHSQLKSEEELV